MVVIFANTMVVIIANVMVVIYRLWKFLYATYLYSMITMLQLRCFYNDGIDIRRHGSLHEIKTDRMWK